MPNAIGCGCCWSVTWVSVCRYLSVLYLGLALVVTGEMSRSNTRKKDPPQLFADGKVSDKQLMEGETLQLSCPVVSSPPAIVTWEKDRVTVEPVTWERHQINPDGMLSITDLEVADSGTYLCRATNGFGTASFEFRVIVLGYPSGVPEFTQPFMANITVFDGLPAIFRCHLRSASHPNIQWLKKFDELEEDFHQVNSTIMVNGQWFAVVQRGPVHVQDLTSGLYISKYTISSTTVSSSGLYICVATNTDGFSAYGAHLCVLPRSRNHSNGGDGTVVEYAPAVGILPLATTAVFIFVFGLILAVTFAYLRRRKSHVVVERLPESSSMVAAPAVFQAEMESLEKRPQRLAKGCGEKKSHSSEQRRHTKDSRRTRH